MNSSFPPPNSDQRPTGVRRIARSLWLRGLLGDVTSQPEVELLSSRMTELFIPRGEYLFHAGSASDSIYFIVSGRIRHGQEGYKYFSPPDVLGFVDASKERAHKWDAVADEDSIVLALASEDWNEFLEDNFDFFRQMMFRRVPAMPLSALNPWDEHGDAFDALVAAHSDSMEEDETPTERLVHCLTALHCSPLLRRASIQAIAQLARSAEIFDVGPEWFEPKQSKLGLWVVGAGMVRSDVRHGDRHVSEEIGPGALIGSLVPLKQSLEHMRVKGAPRGRVLWVGEELFFDVMEDHFDVARAVLDYMASQVERLNASHAEGWQQGAVPQSSTA